MEEIRYNYATIALGDTEYFESWDKLDDARNLASKHAKKSGILNVAIVDLRRKIIEMVKGDDINSVRGKLRVYFDGISCRKGKVREKRKLK